YGMSSFKNTMLEQTLKDTGSDIMVVIGMYAEFCVAATFFSGIERDFSSYVGDGGLIAWNNPGGIEATELLCGTATEELVREKLGL
ncbi:MAG: isochorismatase family protein, partial [Candidatus Methanomethylophilaceae archaeon]|nr:isochorismatase family protein [Candidatus Methanomethylophilaceae archaeon]